MPRGSKYLTKFLVPGEPLWEVDDLLAVVLFLVVCYTV